jgi:hypothetical protein
MAVRDRPTGFLGGVGRWVSGEEAREIAGQMGALSTVGELVAWLEQPLAESLGTATALLGYRARLGVAGDPFEPGALARGLIVRVAARRRHEAIVSWARERRLNLPAVLEPDGQGRSPLERCATCGVPLTELSCSRFYCDAHRGDERAELDALLEAKA